MTLQVKEKEMKSARTIKVIRNKNIFFIVSNALWIGTALFLVFVCCVKLGSKEAVEEASTQIISNELKAIIYSLSTTLIIGIIVSIIIKDKIRTFIWMVSVITAAILFNSKGMYCVLALWFVEEYIFHALYIKYKNLVQINKEIDLRED